MTRILRAADLFCGAGGSTTGAEASGKVRVVLAVNHWAMAIKSHSENHPHTRHICARIDDIDPRHDGLPRFELLLASPECTHHSIARGGMPVDDQKRATPWHVCAWAEARRPNWIVVENVPEFRSWGPIYNGKPIASRKGETFNAWLNSLRSLGYHVEYQLLNAADYGEATRRIRLFVVARRGSGKIRWPAATHAGKWRAAAEIIDWARECPSIFARKRPLADKTLKRIELGLRKFVGMAFQLKAAGRCPGLTKAIDEPLPTIVAAKPNHSVVVPFIVPNFGERDGQDPRTHALDQPLPTVTSHGAGQLVMPFLVGAGGPIYAGKPRPVTTPLNTVTCENHKAVVTPYLIDVNHGDKGRSAGGRLHSLDKPLGTVTGSKGKALLLPFLTEYYGTGGPRSVKEPVTTLTTKPRHGLAIVELLETMQSLGVVDIGFRMLDVDELAAAQGFPKGYVLHGTKAERIKQVGNAVCPGVMKAICESIALAA